MSNIIIDPSNGRLGNQLYSLMTALSVYESNKSIIDKIYFKNYENNNRNIKIIDEDVLDVLKSNIFFNKIFEFDKEVFDNIWEKCKSNISPYHCMDSLNFPADYEKNILVNNYNTAIKYISPDEIRKYFWPNMDYIKEIYNLYGNLNDTISIHIRRGDYLWENNSKIYYSPSKEYIKKIYDKYFCEDDKFICLSDDIEWCKENLSFIRNIIFADKCSELNGTLIDLYIPMLCKGNICSVSTFGMFGATLNPNKFLIVNDPQYLKDDWNNNWWFDIIPEWGIREPIN